MLIKVADIRKIRQIAKNISDERVEIYIQEAELLDLLPRIGADFYQQLSEIGAIDLGKDEGLLKDENGTIVLSESEGTLSANMFKFLNGGYFVSKTGETKRIEGVRKALCYFAYARFIRNHSSQVTPFGVVSKMGDESSSVDLKTITALSTEASKIGEEFLVQCLNFWNEVKGIDDINLGKGEKRRRFFAIGD